MQQTQKANTPEIFCTESSSTTSSASPVEEEEEERKKEQERARRLSVLLIKWDFLIAVRAAAALQVLTPASPLHPTPLLPVLRQSMPFSSMPQLMSNPVLFYSSFFLLIDLFLFVFFTISVIS